MRRKEWWKYLLWVLVATVWTTVCFIAPDFIESPMDGWRGLLLQAAFLVVFGTGALFAIYAIGSSRHLCAVLLPLWAIAGAALTYYRLGYHVTLTPTIIDVTLRTNPEEAMGVISWHLIAWVALQLVICGVLVWWRWKQGRLTYGWMHALAACIVGGAFLFSNGRLHNSLCHRFPYNIPYAVHTYMTIQRAVQEQKSVPDYEPIEIPDSISLVLVFGEAVRADHLQLNGYPRETTPLLAARSNIISFPHIYCEQAYTAASLPHMLTRADSLNNAYQYTETSFISVMRQEGFYTAWVSNQDNGTTFSRFLSECDTVVFANAGKSVYIYSQWLDQDLVKHLRDLRQHRHERELYILHPIGSHWFYNNHVPEDRYFFQPVATNRTVTANSVEQIINSYDNTVRYMDEVLDSLISCFQDQCALVIYQADHGEALGEEGRYLHANDAQEAKNPACIIWYSDRYAMLYPDKIRALSANRHKHYRTDYVFYSILSAAGIRGEGETEEMNIFR